MTSRLETYRVQAYNTAKLSVAASVYRDPSIAIEPAGWNGDLGPGKGHGLCRRRQG